MDGSPEALLEQARKDSGLSLDELWVRYFELTGVASILELEAYLNGALVLDPLQYDIVAHALNERFMEMGENHPVPYRESVT